MEKLRPDTFVHELSPGVLQVGSRPESMVILSNLTPSDVQWVHSMRVPRPRAQSRTRARKSSRLTKKQKELLGYLGAAGLLATAGNAMAGLQVRIVGLNGVGARVAVMLAQAGVAALELRDRGSVDARVENAYSRGSSGLVRQTALRNQVLKQNPDVRVGAINNPDLVVVCGKRAWDHGTLGRLLSQDRIHVPITQDNESVTVGPLIAPGITACALCVDLHVQDSHPLWAKSTFALAAAPPAAPPDYLSAAAAGLAVSMISAVAAGKPLQGEVEPMGSAGGSSQSWTVSQGGVEVRSWKPHPRCTCSTGLVANVQKPTESFIAATGSAATETSPLPIPGPPPSLGPGAGKVRPPERDAVARRRGNPGNAPESATPGSGTGLSGKPHGGAVSAGASSAEVSTAVASAADASATPRPIAASRGIGRPFKLPPATGTTVSTPVPPTGASNGNRQSTAI